MSLIYFKLFAAFTLFIVAMVGGLLPIKIMQEHKKALALGDAFASGIFLGAALFHMLPDAETGFRMLYPTVTYPLAGVLCIAGFFLLLITERIVVEINHNEQDKTKITGLLLLIVLSIHSVIEGSAVGINLTFATAFVIYIAILAHKGSAGFALAINLRRSQLTTHSIIWMITIFALMSPLGIVVATLITELLQQQTGKIIEASFNAFAAGTFLYIGTRHLMERRFSEFSHTNRIEEFSAVLVGTVLMALLAIWV